MDSQGRSILNSYESTEHALLDSFKAAANKVTALYKDSLTQNRRAFGAGYQQAFQDLYGFLSTHAHSERDSVPVEDILCFLRQKNAQLVEELGGESSTTTVPPTPPVTANNTNTTAANQSSQSQQQQQQQTLDIGEMKQQINEAQQQQMFSTQIIPSTPAGFQIDPNTQFTFTPPTNTLLPRYGSGGLTTWGNDIYHLENHGDAVKRRHGGSDFSFMGRSLSNMNVDTMEQPLLKRGKSSKREDL
ncbi:hypothetical protein BDA99DRAFT_513672 [Phascolomyces articulosus]|uniref:Uncharacterized protein n=1 Tax=Phascolomyces articulosus TaxID=60185 RepID=A0AAD5PEJ7_9FUNG|nr:hypothetical protein BDA99DRAFT_513672 [Phascolomyces articulosus]